MSHQKEIDGSGGNFLILFIAPVFARYPNYQCKDLWKGSGNNRNKPFNRHSNYADTTDANNNFISVEK